MIRPYISKYFKTRPRGSVKSSPAQGALVKSASSNKESPVQSTQDKDDDRSEIIITFWSVEQYRKMQETGLPEWQHITIHDTVCSAEQETQLKRLITALVTQAIHAPRNVPGLRVKPTTQPRFEFLGKCQAQWLPVYNLFDLKVENGGGGKCENEECFGFIFLETGHGLLEKMGMGVEDGSIGAFYDTTDSADRAQFESHHASLRVSS